MPVTIPPAFIASTIAREGECAQAWLSELPATFEACCRRWSLTPDGAAWHGYLGVVQPVRRGDGLAALKITWPDPDAAFEAEALRLWDGRGAARLLNHNPSKNAMLLERLDAKRPLSTLSPDEGLRVAGKLLRRLAVPAPTGFPTTDDHARRLQTDLPQRWSKLDNPFGPSHLDNALSELPAIAKAPEHVVVNHDLHHNNVLAGLGGRQHDWFAIDPKVAAGDLAYGVAQLLWQDAAGVQNPDDLRHRLRMVADAAQLDLTRVTAWFRLRTLDYGLWAVAAGLTQDPLRCARFLESV